MADVSAPNFMFATVPTISSAARAYHRVVRVPFVAALLDQPSRYTLTDPRISFPPPPEVMPKRGRPRGPTAATLEKLLREANGDHVAFKRALERRLRKQGLMPRMGTHL